MELNSKNIRKILFIIFCGALIFAVIENFERTFLVLGNVISVFTPIIAALSIAFILNIPLSLLENKVFAFMAKSKKKFVTKLRRPVCLVLTYLLALGFVALLILVIIPDIVETVIYLFEKMPAFVMDAKTWLEDLLKKFNIDSVVPEIKINWSAAIDTIKTWFSNSYAMIFNNAVDATTSVFGGLFDGVFSLMISVYVLAQKERIGGFTNRFINRFFKPNWAKNTFRIASKTYDSFARFIKGQFTEAVILGTLCFIGMLIFRFPNALIISVIVGVAALVPVIGSIVGAIIGALLILITSPIKAVLFIVFLIVLQQLEGNLIYPRVMGKAVGLPGVLVVSAVLVGGNIGGVLGALLAVPTCAVIFALIKESIDNQHNLKVKGTEND